MNCTSCPSTVRVSQGGYNVKGETKRPPYAKGGGVGLTAHGSGLPAWWGRSPLGVSFERAKGTKTHLGRSPLRTSLGVRGWTCVKLVFGPSLLLWLLSLPPHQDTLGHWPYGWVVSTAGPTLEKRRSRRREPGFRPLGTAAHQGKALGSRSTTHQRSRHCPSYCHAIHVTPPGQGPQRGGRRDTPYRGVDSTRRGKAPPLAVFGDFLAAESHPSGASPPGV